MGILHSFSIKNIFMIKWTRLFYFDVAIWRCTEKCQKRIWLSFKFDDICLCTESANTELAVQTKSSAFQATKRIYRIHLKRVYLKNVEVCCPKIKLIICFSSVFGDEWNICFLKNVQVAKSFKIPEGDCRIKKSINVSLCRTASSINSQVISTINQSLLRDTGKIQFRHIIFSRLYIFHKIRLISNNCYIYKRHIQNPVRHLRRSVWRK